MISSDNSLFLSVFFYGFKKHKIVVSIQRRSVNKFQTLFQRSAYIFVAVFDGCAEECEVNISVQPGDSSDATAIKISGKEHALGRAGAQIELQFQAFAEVCGGLCWLWLAAIAAIEISVQR